MKTKYGFLFIFIFLFVSSYGQVVINEVMYAPTSPAKEWFEIYNLGSAAVNLQNWKWRDAATSNPIRTITTLSINLNANSYAIICEDSVNFRQAFPTATGQIIQSIGWNALNNTGNENVVLYNSTSVTQDSLTYTNSWGGGTGGFSLERKNPAGATNLQSNWGTCIDPNKATPNRSNSLTPKQNDLILKSFVIAPANPIVGDNLNFNIEVKNIGLNSANNFSVKLFRDVNFDSIPQPGELMTSQIYTSLNINDSLFFAYAVAATDSGLKQFIAYIDFPSDEDTLNNKSIKSVYVGASVNTSTVVINEVMYAPVSPVKEWFEIYNLGASAVNLQNWKWRDAATSNPIRTITAQSVTLNPNSYAIICEDSTNFRQTFPNVICPVLQSNGWSALNNTGNENVVLYNSSSQTQYSLTYNDNWGGNTGGYSLERIDAAGPINLQSNWGTSIDHNKATPGRKNSITPKPNDLSLKSFSITPASPTVGSTLNFSIEAKNIGLNSANNFSVKLFRDMNFDSIPQPGELISSQIYSLLNANDSLFFTYSISNIDSGLKQYIGFIDYSIDEDTLNNKSVKSVNVGGSNVTTGLLINEIMYAPQSPEPEWVEIFNNSNSAINIKNWKLADSSSLSSPITITLNDYLIQSNSYLVIAKSNAIVGRHPLIDTTKVIYLSNLPTLNNDKDVVAIFNNAGVQVDYVSYKSNWGGASRNSLERLSSIKPSNYSSNWVTSIDCEYSTPTRVNSFSNVTAYQRGDFVINEIMFDPLTGSAEYVEFYNPTSKILNINGWKLSESAYFHNLSDSCNATIRPGDFLVMAVDTTIYNRFPNLKLLSVNQHIVFRSSLSLSNDGELLKLYDVLNNIIDSVHYTPKWHNPNLADEKGYSLERINPTLNSNDPANWSSCANALGGTPGLQNSIYINNNLSSTSKVIITPNPFSPDGDGRDEVTFINYKLNQPISQIRIKVYDVKGRIVRNLVSNQISGSEGTVIFNGYGDDGQKLRVGIYIIYFEAVDARGGVVDNVKTTVVLSTKLN